jgi:hypothetical protein
VLERSSRRHPARFLLQVFCVVKGHVVQAVGRVVPAIISNVQWVGCVNFTCHAKNKLFALLTTRIPKQTCSDQELCWERSDGKPPTGNASYRDHAGDQISASVAGIYTRNNALGRWEWLIPAVARKM